MIYEFKRDDGGIVERMFSVDECPREITCEDGQRAVKIISGSYIRMMGGDGHVTGDGAQKLNADMRRRQAEAGRRMRDSWESCAGR